jgi:repressor LexA
MDDLTPRQKAILRYIRDSLCRRGYPPSIREIGQRFDIASTNGVRYHLGVLEETGYLKREEYTSRGIRLADPKGTERFSAEGAPVLGRVPAGPLNLALEEVERWAPIDRSLFALGEGETVFCLRVEGDSMAGAGILDGDLVVVRKSGQARSGQIVVARIGEEATVKRLERKGRRVRLLPENPAYEPIEVGKAEAEEFQILGVVTGLIRPQVG